MHCVALDITKKFNEFIVIPCTGIDITESGLLSYNSSSFREKDPGGMKAC